MKLIKSFQFGEFTSEVAFYSKQTLLPTDTDILIVDNNTGQLINLPLELETISLQPGEKEKQWPAVDSILQKAIAMGLGRDALMVGMGGGVITDMSAFAASLYMRGCKAVLIPTTLLAMVDAAMGGKTAVDSGPYKNMIGTFYPAAEVRICPEILATLPEVEYMNGLGEVIKTALIGDAELFQLLIDEKEAILNRDVNVLTQMIERCVMVKGALVEEDLREQGRRAFLNLGHTFGHALEAVSNFAWPHGAAVVWGMAKALSAAVALGYADKAWAKSVTSLFIDYGYELEADFDTDALLNAMKMDKKKRGGKLRFILPAAQGDMRIEYLEDDFLRTIL